MSERRITTVEFEAAVHVRDGVKGDLWDLLPKLRPGAVILGVESIEGQAVVAARIAGDTTPYGLGEVEFYLGELGVGRIEIQGPSPEL